MRHEDKRRLAGRLAEEYVERETGLCEPDVEIKAVAKHEGRVLLRLSQLQEAVSQRKVYIFVLYDCKAKRRGNKMKFGRTVEDAFKDKEAGLIRVEASAVAKACRSARLDWVEYREGHGQFKVKLSLKKIQAVAFVPDGEVPF